MSVTTPNSVPGYYRSRIISSSTSSNNLISAAAPLFLLAEKLQQTNFSANRAKLLQDLIHEIKAFENKASIAGFNATNIVTARTALSALLDTIIANTQWGKENNWEINTLTTNWPQTETNVNFFNLLEHSLKNAAENIELLELFYLILSFGFEGEYSAQANKHQTLNAIIDKLYTTIKQQRSLLEKNLLITTNSATIIKTKPNWKKLLLLALGIIVLCNLGAYLTYRIKLGSMLHPINTMIKQHNESIQNMGGAAK